jgi:hypothetical protein
MSALQRIHARTILNVDRELAGVLRQEAKKIAMFEHDLFEDYLDFAPGAQYSLALRYRGVFDLLDAVGWDPEAIDHAKHRFHVPLTEDLINLLGLRREDLILTARDRINEHEEDQIPPEILEEITTHRLDCVTLDRLFHAYARVTKETQSA